MNTKSCITLKVNKQTKIFLQNMLSFVIYYCNLIISEVWPYILTDSHQYKHTFIYVMCISHSVFCTAKGYMNPTVLIPNFTKANSHKVQMKGHRESKQGNIWISIDAQKYKLKKSRIKAHFLPSPTIETPIDMPMNLLLVHT